MKIIVTDLLFGDSGKGLMTASLARQFNCEVGIRSTGGPQAAHHVHLEDGRKFCFAQLSSVLAAYPGAGVSVMTGEMIVSPWQLLKELSAFKAWFREVEPSRILVDRDCLVLHPLHTVAARSCRRTSSHGSCGMGVGVARSEWYQDPAKAITVGDLEAAFLHDDRAVLAAKEQALLGSMNLRRALQGERSVEADIMPGRTMDQTATWTEFLSKVTVCSRAEILELVRKRDCVFEGAQGVLLDQDWGFHPHTTWSRVTAVVPQRICSDAGVSAVSLGVLRTYATRHGPGPLLAETSVIRVEEDNRENPWQGRMRYAYHDVPLLHYALGRAGVQGLLVTHTDYVPPSEDMRAFGVWAGPELPPDILVNGPDGSLAGRERLTAAMRLRGDYQGEGHFHACLPGEIPGHLAQQLRVPLLGISCGAQLGLQSFDSRRLGSLWEKGGTVEDGS